MHIVLIPSWYKTPSSPIRGSFFIDQAHALQEHGHQVGMLVPPSIARTWHGVSEIRRFWRRSPTDISRDNDDGFPTFRVPWWGWWATLNPLARPSVMATAFEQYIAHHGTPDILHGHAIIYGGFIAATLGEQYDLPVVITEHASTYLTGILPVHFGHQWIVQQAVRQCDALVAVSQNLANGLKKYVPDYQAISVVGNMVDTQTFQPADTPLPLSPFVFTAIGRLEPAKGYHHLLDAFAQEFKGRDVHLNIIGQGSQWNALHTQAQQLDIASQCTFQGQLPHDQIPSHIQNSHVIVSASDYETFGVTLIEAMACGKPVIATRSGGPQYFVDDRNGILIPCQDVQALANAMKHLHQNYDAYSQQAIRDHCLRRFSKESIVNQLEEIYHHVLA